MKSNLGRAIRFIAILLLVAFTGAATAHAQGVSPLVGTAPSLTNIPTRPGPAIGEQFTELSSGVFTYSKTDLSLPGPMPINVTRVYRSTDITGSWNERAFGIGTALNYDMFVTYYLGGDVAISMPDSSTLSCSTSTGGPPYTCNSQPSGVWFGSVLDGNNNLTRPDGTVYSFDATTRLLKSITDRYTNSITISRGPSAENSACYTGTGNYYGSVPASYVGMVSSSNGRAVYFCYDDRNNTTDITGIADNAAGGPIKKVAYTYGSGGTLNTVTQGNDPNAVTTYQYNQTSPSGVGNITTIIVNDFCPSGGCGTPNKVYTYITYVSNNLGTAVGSLSSQLPGNGYQYSYHSPAGYPASHVTVHLPDSAVRDFYFDSAGYLTEDARNVGVNGVTPEYTFFARGPQNGGQTVGTSTEFVGEVDEDDQNQNIVRKTTYNYDTTAGNIKGVTLGPAPGQSGGTATWNYTYTTFNRLASAVEPLANNGVGTIYTYVDTPPTSQSMTVTDPLGRVTTVDYNAQGQPISVTDPMRNPPTTIQYYSSGGVSGDLKSITDPIGNTTTYVTDSDGRVKSVTSPLQGKTQYSYDAIDDVIQIIDPMNNYTCNTYDLIGELTTTNPPRGVYAGCSYQLMGYTTIVTRSANLGKLTVTDPAGYTTVTNLDGQGRKTDYTDKRGVETTYSFDKFGRITQSLFNSKSIPGYQQEQVAMLDYDALDRVGMVYDSVLNGSSSFTYDSLDSILSETVWVGTTEQSVSYTYDSNGRRTSMAPSWEGALNYGYDCADELVSMSNNGSALQSCSPSTRVNYTGNISSSAQVAFNLDSDGNPVETLVDGVDTQMTHDPDERVIAQTFQQYPIQLGNMQYGNLTYQYDPDGHLVDKGGSLAAVNMPAAVPTASYSNTDQVSVWNAKSTSLDQASNLKYDPASGLTFTWTARNQMSTAGVASETYDGLGRRLSSTGGNTLDFVYDGSTMIGWTSVSSGAFYNFMTLPGGAAVAGSFTPTSGGTATTWVPLIDTAGSTIALVNAASTGSAPATTYTYDPSGNPTVSGTANNWPFLYQGLEKEFTDPGPLYYSGGGQFYSPQLARSLSGTGQTSSRGSGGSGGGGAGGGGASRSGQGTVANAAISNDCENGDGECGPGQQDSASVEINISIDWNAIGHFFDQVGHFFQNLWNGIFGDGNNGSPPTPRQLLRGPHPLYSKILGAPPGLVPTEQDDADGAVRLLAQAVEPGDDPLLRPDVKDDEKEQIARELEAELPNLKGKARNKVLERLRKYRARPSKRAHGADIKNKFSFVPLIPEPPLAAAGEGLEAGEAGEALLELLGALAL